MVVGVTITYAISAYHISIRARCTTLCDKVCQWLATGRWFSPGPSVSSINKTERHDITEILLKVALNTIKQTNKQTNVYHHNIMHIILYLLVAETTLESLSNFYQRTLVLLLLQHYYHVLQTFVVFEVLHILQNILFLFFCCVFFIFQRIIYNVVYCILLLLTHVLL
jgi:hypothetical protein